MYIILWEYLVKIGRELEFEKIYGSHGEWVQLFKQSDGYLGTDLICDINIPHHYITVDRWTSSVAYDVFKKNFQALYEELDARCESLTEHEKLIGRGKIISST